MRRVVPALALAVVTAMAFVACQSTDSLSPVAPSFSQGAFHAMQTEVIGQGETQILYAGQTIDAGTVSVAVVGENIEPQNNRFSAGHPVNK